MQSTLRANRIPSLIIFVTLLLLSLASLSFPAHAATNGITPRGGLNLDGYCKSIGDQGASLDGNTAYDWRCVTSSGQHVSIDMTNACNWQYNDSQAIDVMGNYYDPSSWLCYSGISDRGGLDLNQYCLVQGDQSVSLDGNTAYDWRCVTSSGQHVSIDMTNACNWQYNWTTVARVGNFYDPSTWQCWD